MFYKKDVLINFVKLTERCLCQGLFLIQRETLVQVFSWEFCEIFKNTIFTHCTKKCGLPADLVTFTEEIFNRKLHFLYRDRTPLDDFFCLFQNLFSIRSNLQVAQNGRFVINPIRPGNGTKAAKILVSRLFESLKMRSPGPFALPNYLWKV